MYVILTLKLFFTMKKNINFTSLVDMLADYIVSGIHINIDSESEVKTISEHNPKNGKAVKFTFKVPVTGVCQIGNWEETQESVKKPED